MTVSFSLFGEDSIGWTMHISTPLNIEVRNTLALNVVYLSCALINLRLKFPGFSFKLKLVRYYFRMPFVIDYLLLVTLLLDFE